MNSDQLTAQWKIIMPICDLFTYCSK